MVVGKKSLNKLQSSGSQLMSLMPMYRVESWTWANNSSFFCTVCVYMDRLTMLVFQALHSSSTL